MAAWQVSGWLRRATLERLARTVDHGAVQRAAMRSYIPQPVLTGPATIYLSHVNMAGVERAQSRGKPPCTTTYLDHFPDVRPRLLQQLQLLTQGAHCTTRKMTLRYLMARAVQHGTQPKRLPQSYCLAFVVQLVALGLHPAQVVLLVTDLDLQLLRKSKAGTSALHPALAGTGHGLTL